MILLDAGIQPSEIDNLTMEEAMDLAHLRVLRAGMSPTQVIVPSPVKWGCERRGRADDRVAPVVPSF